MIKDKKIRKDSNLSKRIAKVEEEIKNICKELGSKIGRPVDWSDVHKFVNVMEN